MFSGLHEESVSTSLISYLNALVFIFINNSSLVFFYVFFNDTFYYSAPFMMIGHASTYLIVLISLFGRTSITKCINSVAKVYCMSSAHCSKQHFSVFATLLSPCFNFLLAIITHFNIDRILFGTMLEISSMPILATSLLVCNLCTVCERAYIHLNDQLAELSECRFSSRILYQLEVLTFQFERVTDVMKEVIRCFGVMLAAILTEFTLRLILMSYVMSRNSPPIGDKGFGIHLVICVSLLTTFSLPFFILCHCSQQITNQVSKHY